jgi:hypothetical protein
MARMQTLSSWHTPASSYPDSQVGAARIETHHYKPGLYQAYGLRGTHYRVARTIAIRGLAIDNKTWMVDDPPHWWAMQDHARHYEGRVVCAGLGLGLIVHTLHENPKVREIVVIERDQDVIDLVEFHLPQRKLTIERGDFWEWDGQADGLLFDLFVGDGRQLLPIAMRTYLELRKLYPLVRIHGFKNDDLEKLWRDVNEASNAARRLGNHGRRLLWNPGH